MNTLALAALTLLVPVFASASDTPAAGQAKPRAKAAPAYTLYAAGDIADCAKKPALQTGAAKTANLIAAALEKDPQAFAVTLGDNTYPVGAPSEFTECYEPTWGRFKERTLPSPGNHDYGQPKALGYYNYFGELAGPDRRGYYSKKLGNWTLYSLNSQLSGNAMQTQLQWLKEELQKNKSRCTLAFWHHPAYSSGGHGNNKQMWPAWKLLADAGADIVLASHDHDYERFVPMNAQGEADERKGIRSFVVGTGGAKLTPMFFPKATTEIRDNNNHGVLKLVLQENSYSWEFLSIPGDNLRDSGNGSCH